MLLFGQLDSVFYPAARDKLRWALQIDRRRIGSLLLPLCLPAIIFCIWQLAVSRQWLAV
jgi:hypothetical protein